jgi:hypothetical protein
MLGNLVRSMEGLDRFTENEAAKLGLEALGKLDAQPEGAKVLKFPIDFDNKLRVKWDEVDAQLDAIGKPTGMYTIPKQLLMGIRGDKGDVLIRLLDVGLRRLDGVLQYLVEKLP